MLTMIVYYHCKDGLRDAFMAAVKMEKIAENSRVEPGNMQYVISCLSTTLTPSYCLKNGRVMRLRKSILPQTISRN